MASKTRSSDGCWTCRLRRKKCDEVRPLCNACRDLEIDCLYGDEKPGWMDGAEKQKEKADWLKLDVKRKATHRRERRYLQGLELGLESLDVSQADDSDPSNVMVHVTPAASSVSSSHSPASRHPQDSTPESGGHHASISGLSCLSTPTPAPSTPEESPNPLKPAAADGPGVRFNEREMNMIVLYLDYVFPFLFPFYRPMLLDSGRGWLLILFARNKALLHTALSLATYFFNVVLNTATGSHDDCKIHNWAELQKQQDLALKELQGEMRNINVRGVKGYLAETNHVMASIIQLLTFEVAIANTGNWVMHLDAATELFAQIMKEHGTAPSENGGGVCFTLLLIQLGARPYQHTPMYHPWSAGQASLRFFTAFLLLFDTLASTALEQPPRLQQWHYHLLSEPDDETRKMLPDDEKEYKLPHIDLKEFVGLHNWVVISIGEIAALDAWKKEMKKNGSLSMTQLVARATTIEASLRAHMVELEMPARPDPNANMNPLALYISHTSQNGLISSFMMEATGSINHVWAQAGLTYLSVVVSGWQPACPEIRSSVVLSLQMFTALPSPGCLRTLVWPFTITGCMAAPDEEQTFRDLVAAMGPLQAFGTIPNALAIMEFVWAHRKEIEENADQWDIAACFNSLGSAALLV
ncbi:fungal-specific transcription factor domain-containing protein [Lasiosphaeris hirsuta]|uniref:Fungal-specific transcription factor domain-containing protein n=1 Tax=Lasiosphaeris hirsuta TaxID=260670 RepID=A0AA40B9N3_9PEZI|nr:fungal-specific transcription factor domain-containing protein [Lasiosphaeris hirsuta]